MFSLLYYCWYNFVTERITLDYTLRRYAAVLFRLVCVGFCGGFFFCFSVCLWVFLLLFYFCSLLFCWGFFLCFVGFFLLFEVFLGGGVVFWRGGRYSTSMLYIVQQSALKIFHFKAA